MTYDGLFDLEQLYKMITDWLEEKGYDQREMVNATRILQEGKYHEVWIQPWKKVTDYHKYEISARMIFDHMKAVTVTHEGKQVQLMQGRIHILFDGYLTYDWENKWESKPMFFFIRTLFDKFFYRSYTTGIQQGLKKEIEELQGRINSFLNLYKR